MSENQYEKTINQGLSTICVRGKHENKMRNAGINLILTGKRMWHADTTLQRKKMISVHGRNKQRDVG